MWSFTFYVWNDTLDSYEQFGNEQWIKNDEKPVIPQPTGSDALEFAGWYVTDSTDDPGLAAGDTAYNFDQIPTFTEDGGTNLYAKYVKYAYVVFHDQYDIAADTWPVAYTRRVKLTGAAGSEMATVRIDDLSVGYSGSENIAFLGWSRTQVKTPGEYRDPDTHVEYAIAASEIKVSEETHLYPIYRPFHWLNYYTAQSGLGAAYVPALSVFDGEGVVSPLPTTSRDGYEFLGWYTGSLVSTTVGGKTVETVTYGKQVTDAQGNLHHDSIPYLDGSDGGVYMSAGLLHLSANATLYAKWKAQYRIVIWKQSPTDEIDDDDGNNHYLYFDTITETAEIGASVSFDNTSISYTGYAYDHDDGPKTIANTDTITVLNVYYDLTEPYSGSGSYTLSFSDSVEGSSIVMPAPIADISFGTPLSAYSVQSPADRTSDKGYVIYKFSGWFMDQACTVPADLSTMVMPDRNLTLYAGWSAEWFIVKIEPCYGALYYYDSGELKGDGSTWFWQTYEDEPIGEYTYIARDYVPSSSGSYYFVQRDRAYYGYTDDEWHSGEPQNRQTYYTQNISEATEDTTFEYAADAYSYIGWYEVFPDGSEAAEPYDFTQHVDHNTTLRLHWKKNGSFYLGYNSGAGDLDSDGTKTEILSDRHSDYAGITINRTAIAPYGYTFVGWRVRGIEGGQIYTPGQMFTLHADAAVRENGKDVVWLDAVYIAADSVEIVYNANGGTIYSELLDYGKKPTSQGGEPTPVSGTIDAEAGTVTVSGLKNNSAFILSSGEGFSRDSEAPAGWSTNSVYNPAADTLYACGGSYGVDTVGGNTTTLYAVWPVKVTYHLNAGTDDTASWGSGWGSYAYDTGSNTYTQTSYIGWDTRNGAFIGRPVDQPAGIPNSDSRMFFFWTTTADDDTTAYDFSQQVTGALDLYAYWGGDIQVPIRAVDASAEDLAEKSEWVNEDGGEKVKLAVGKNLLDLTAAPEQVMPPDGYTYAFAVALKENAVPSRENVFHNDAIASIYYNQAKRHLYVKYQNTSRADASLDEGTDIFFVYYKQRELGIGYKQMLSTGELVAVTQNAAAPTATGVLTDESFTYNMTDHVTAPRAWAGGSFAYYAFALGDIDPGADMNASALRMITTASNSDSALPALTIRNTWQGIQYTTDGTDWISGGYDGELYVVYYGQNPTIVMFREQTVGTEAVMETYFQFDLMVTETTTTTKSVQKQKLVEGEWVNDGEPVVTTTGATTTPIFDTTASGNQPYLLKNGEANSAILFYSNTSGTPVIGTEYEDGGESFRDVTTTTTVTAQTARITQTAEASFTTTNNAVGANKVSETECTYTASGGGTIDVTFTNRHKSLPVEVHVALLENGGITLKDSEYRSSEKSFSVLLGESADFLTRLPSETVFTGPGATYALGAILYGTDNGSTVAPAGMGVSSIAYKQVSGDVYELLLDGDAEKPLGEYKIYYLYFTMPQIFYMKTDSSRNMEAVQGSTDGSTVIDTITYNRQPLQMNGVTVEQGQKLDLPVNGIRVVSQAGNNFRMPGNLDDGIYRRYLSYAKLGAGDVGKTSLNDIELGDGLTLFLRLQEDALEYSFTGEENDYTAFSGTPAIYAIYEERGYDLMLTKTVDTSASGAKPIFDDASFTVTISSPAITKSSYGAEGYESATIDADPDAHTITIPDVGDGLSIRIKGLGQGEYAITETENKNYVLTAKYGTIVGGTTETAYIETLPDGSGSVVKKTAEDALVLDSEMRVDLTNTPQKLCKIVDGGTEHIFYTFADAISYVEENIANRTATIEMLADYLVPAEDALEIPYGYHITLTTAIDGTAYSGTSETGAVITRSPSLAAAPVITNNGELSISYVNIDGAEIEASAPLIQSSGNLTVGLGAVLKNAVSTGNGAAIYATDGNITIDQGMILNNRAANGAAIYYVGTGTISMLQSAEISGNEANGNGGAIYAAQGEFTMSGGTIQDNNAGGSGGAIYAYSASVTVSGGTVYHNTAAAGDGGAIYAGSGAVEVSGGTVDNNTATTGNGGAVYAGSGHVTVSGGSVSGNTSMAGSGGAVYAGSGNVTVSGGSLTGNTAKTDGGAVYAGGGSITVSAPDGGTAPSISGNTATSGKGGALYADRGAVSITGTTLTKNTAGSDGGAVYAGSGTVTITDSVFGGDAATDGNTAGGSGGAVYAGSGNVTVSGGSMQNNKATGGSGGALYANTGAVSITGTSLSENTANTDGGAIYAGGGHVTMSGGSLTGNTATNGKGGAVYAQSGNVGISNATVTGNSAKNDGGVVYAGSGAVTLTSCTTVTGNKATNGNGGVVCTTSGNVTISGSSFGGDAEGAGNSAKNGGVVYTASGTVSVTGGTMNKNAASDGNGGAICNVSGNVTLSGIGMTGNTATENGGALYAGSGTVSVTGTSSLNTNSAKNGGALYLGSGTANLNGVTMTGNTATTGSGGAAYADSGNLTLSGGSMTKNTAGEYGGVAYAGSGTLTVSGGAKLGNADYTNANQAKNGAAIYIKEGTGIISTNNTAIQYNIATDANGGAVGVGDASARLFFSDNVTVKNNRQQSSDGPIANVCLDQDSDTVVNTSGLGGSAEIGIYVPGPFDGDLFKHRGAASALFASFTSNSNLAKFKNDRNTGLTAAQADNNKVRWVKTLTVEVRYLGSFENGFPPTAAGTTLFTLTNYVMPSSENGASQIAADIYANYNTTQLKDVYPNASFACAFKDGETEFGNYLTDVNWNGERGFWQFIPRGWDPDADPAPEPITGTKIIVYFSESAYLSIVNNTEESLTLNLSKLEVLSKKAVTDGYGYVTARNGQTVEKLVPIESADLTIPAGHSIKLVFPGAAEKPMTIEGSFSGDSVPSSVPYKVDGADHSLSLNDDHTFVLLDDEDHPYTLPEDGETRELLFGEQALKICEIVEDDRSEWPTLMAAMNRIVELHQADSNRTIFTIALLVDYLQPPSDVLVVPNGYDITLTTSSKYDGDGEVGGEKAATLSRDAGNLGAMIKSDQNTIVNNAFHAAFSIENLIMDGRALVGQGDGGALKTKNATVTINNVYFKGFEATNGGALYVDFDTSDTLTHAYQQTEGDYLATMTVTNTDFLNCRSSSNQDKTGGGALWTTARVLTLENCNITGSSCYKDNPSAGSAQAGAIFHNINMTGRASYSNNSHTYIRNCSFKDCYVLKASGGAVESDALDVVVEDCVFDTCYVKAGSKNGGGLNIYANNTENPNKKNTYTTIQNTQFINCSSTNNGGAFRTTSEYVTMENVTFSKCKAKQGGGFAATGSSAQTLTIRGGSFDSCNASNQGGGVYSNANIIEIYDYTAEDGTVHSSFTNCQATNAGGGIYQNRDNSSFSMTNATVNGNASTNNAGGGIYTNAKTVTLNGGTISNNTAKTSGGGIFQNKDDTFTMTGTTVSGNTATNNAGGGIYMVAKKVTLTNGSISDNKAGGKGGGVYTNAQTSLTIEGTEIKKNTSSGDGGGVWYDGADDTVRGKMTLTLKGCSIDNNTATNGNGGGIFTQVKTVKIGDSGSAETSVSNNTALNGGGIYHKLFTDATLTVTNAKIDGNKANGTGNNGIGGGLRTNAKTLTVTDSSISHNGAVNHGGGVWYDGADDTARNAMNLTVSGSTIGNNTSAGSGGGIYTLVKTVTIGDYIYTDTSGDQQTKHSSVSNNMSKNSGGGLYHKNSSFTSDTDKATLTITNASIDGNEVTASNQLGGGVYTTARALSVTGGSVSHNTAPGNGGGIWYDGDEANRDSMSLTVSDCTVDGNASSAGSGGGIYTLIKTAVINGGSVSTNTAAANGGGIYCSRNTDGASIAITGTTISGNQAGGTNGGGGIYANIVSVRLSGATLSNNKATGASAKGGGILCMYESTFDESSTDPTVGGLTVDYCTISSNSAFTGGGIYSKLFVILRNNTKITGNTLSSAASPAGNAAGVYLEDGRTLVVGTKDASSDTITVNDNHTSAGLPSNLRLWSNSDEQNNEKSVYVYCNLTDSEVQVVNANKVGTRFGIAAKVSPEGFSETYHVFNADYDTLHGVIDRSDPSFKIIIWAGPAICKITDKNGVLLYLKLSTGGLGSDPAIFDQLDNGVESDTSITSAFSLLRAETPELYYADGTPYYGPDYCVKMLDNFTTESPIIVNRYEGKNGSGETEVRNITLTTAGRNDTDNYSYRATTKGDTATVLRGTDVGNHPLVNTNANLTIENIILDGGSLNGITAGSNTRILNVDHENITVKLRKGAALQNAEIEGNGAGVYVNRGSFEIGEESSGAVIRNCNATEDGGAVYVTMYSTLTFNRGNILQCNAEGNGGGVYLQGEAGSGSFSMYGGSIERCTAGNAGGGVFVGNNMAFHMSGTASKISSNSAGNKGGGIAIGGDGSRIYFSGMPTVTGNTCDQSAADKKLSNVELDEKTTLVINTEEMTWNGITFQGLINGANIGVYVTGEEGTDSCYDLHGLEGTPFGTYVEGNNTKTFYSFVNDRNGLKGGLMAGTTGNNIYWVKIFSLEVSKFGENLPADAVFTFEVRLEGEATVSGQPDAKDIDGDYGNMVFHSDGISSTTATVELKLGDGDSWEAGVNCIGENLSDGLRYTVTERLDTEQAKAYAALPTQYTGVIGENNQIGVDVAESERYISRTRFENIFAVCKLTDPYGNLLYYMRSGAKEGEAHIPAVYSSIKAAADALSDTLYSGISPTASSYDVVNGVKLQMLIGSYTMLDAAAFPADVPVTLTTASSNDDEFPYRGDHGTVSTVTRGFTDGSDADDDDDAMFAVNGNLTVTGITLSGAKNTYTVSANGGIICVKNGGSLATESGATLQDSKVTQKGGAVYVELGGTFTMTGGVIQRSEALYGGAVYMDDSGTMAMSGGTIQNNKANKTDIEGNGAGIYLKTGSTLELSGSPSFGKSMVFGEISTTQGNLAGSLTGKNGGKNYYVEHQDICLEESADNPASIVITGELTGDDGSIWVWAESNNHYKTLTPFAVIDTSKVPITDANSETVGEMFKVFRNARDDVETENPLSQTPAYLYGMLKPDEIQYVYWYGLDGFDVKFKKIDGYGTALENAEFSLYTDPACKTALEVSKTAVTGTSDSAGVVTFNNKIPIGVHYMKETTIPNGYANTNTYIVLVGDKALAEENLDTAVAGYLTNVTTTMIKGQTDLYKTAYQDTKNDYDKYAIFLIDSTTNKAVTTPDIAKYGVINISEAERKVILRKVNASYASLEGAQFQIFRYDGTEVKKDGYDETMKAYASLSSGVYFIGNLPYGTYYLYEKEAPTKENGVETSAYNSNKGKWFTLTIGNDSTTAPGSRDGVTVAEITGDALITRLDQDFLTATSN